uniref:Uncharacterized protein n=1 Tax=Arundo donax TaxID=35708 RepID=A0A0A9A3P9_ARUDO
MVKGPGRCCFDLKSKIFQLSLLEVLRTSSCKSHIELMLVHRHRHL